MKDEVAGGGRRHVGAPHPPAAPHARARSPQGEQSGLAPSESSGLILQPGRGPRGPAAGKGAPHQAGRDGAEGREAARERHEREGSAGRAGSRRQWGAAHPGSSRRPLSAAAGARRLAQARYRGGSPLLPPPRPRFTGPPLASRPAPTRPLQAPRRPAPRGPRPGWRSWLPA